MKEIKIDPIKELNDSILSECVETVITTFSYPESSEKTAFKSTF